MSLGFCDSFYPSFLYKDLSKVAGHLAEYNLPRESCLIHLCLSQNSALGFDHSWPSIKNYKVYKALLRSSGPTVQNKRPQHIPGYHYLWASQLTFFPKTQKFGAIQNLTGHSITVSPVQIISCFYI